MCILTSGCGLLSNHQAVTVFLDASRCCSGQGGGGRPPAGGHGSGHAFSAGHVRRLHQVNAAAAYPTHFNAFS